MAPLLDDLRFTARSAGFISLTFSLLGCLEADRAMASESQRQSIIYKWMQRYGLGLLRLYGLEVRVSDPHTGVGTRHAGSAPYPGRDERGLGRIFIMNHRSMLDIFINLAFIEANIVSRADLARWPVIGLAARRVGTLFVDRSSKHSGAAVIAAMCGAIKEGRGVVVYPEGTTFAGDEVRPFRQGAFVAAQRTGAEIVPLGIAYGGQSASFVDEPFVAHYRRIASAPKTQIALHVGEPLRGDHANIEATRELSRERVQSLIWSARAALNSPNGAEG